MSTAHDSFNEMTPEQRLRHVQSLWDRIAQKPEDVPVADGQRHELDRRLAAHRADPDAAIPWDSVRADLFQQK